MNAPWPRPLVYLPDHLLGLIRRRFDRAIAVYRAEPTIGNLRWLVIARRAAIRAGLHQPGVW